MSSKVNVRRVSESFVKPLVLEDGPPTIPLSPWDYLMLSSTYIHKGFLFSKPPSFSMPAFLAQFKHSLSLALDRFYPLAGRLSSTVADEPPSTVVSFNCSNLGARLIHAAADLAINDVLSPAYVPDFVFDFFDHTGSVNHDGHFNSLLSLQVTELTDGIFVGCSMNHTVADGSSYWFFLTKLSEIFKARQLNNELPSIFLPEFDRRVLGFGGGEYSLPYTDPQQFIRPSKPHVTKERFFHLNAETIAKLKAAINAEINTDGVSSLQAVSALVWKSITRARGVPSDKNTTCTLVCDCRPRMEPRVPDNYFGNCVTGLRATAMAGELLGNSLGWAAVIIHRAVIEHDAQKVRTMAEKWIKSPMVLSPEQFFDPYSVLMGSSPRFDMYGVDFGFEKARAIRSGLENKWEGKVSLYPGREGGGSMDLEISLLPEAFRALESDPEFIAYVSPF